MKHRSIRPTILACLLGLLILACGGGTTSPGAGSTASSGASASGGPIHGHLGDTLHWTDLGGDTIAVTLVKLTDPATPADPNNAAVSGDRWVGVELTLVDPQGNPADDSVAADGLGSDGQRYGANTSYHIGGFSGCTTVAGGEGGQQATICAGFMVPTQVTVTSVGYSTTGVDVGAQDDLTWSVP